MTYYFAELKTLNSLVKAEELKEKDPIKAKIEASSKQKDPDSILEFGDKINKYGFIIDPISYKKERNWAKNKV